MSDPLSTVDIEDVLASIRRLVLEGRPEAGDRSAEARPAEARATPGKLVLTPALRVADADRPTRPADRGPDRAPLLVLAPSEPVAPGSSVEVAPDDDAFLFRRSRPTQAPAPVAPPAAHPPSRPDGTPPSEGAPEGPREVPAAAPLAAPGDSADDPLDDPGDLLDEPARRAGPGGAAREPALGVDEATLRAIVAAVVRQELQGELGERVTRNVRKLVRREIFRVLSSQDEP